MTTPQSEPKFATVVSNPRDGDSSALASRLSNADGFRGVRALPGKGYVSADVRLDRILVNRDDLDRVMQSGRQSESPNDPILLSARLDDPHRFELSDGHHRVVRALAEGRSWLPALIDPVADDEPLEGPFFDFGNLIEQIL